MAVEKAPHLHADPCQARVPALEVAQVHVVSQLPLQNLDVHFSICEILKVIILHSCHRQFLGELLVCNLLHWRADIFRIVGPSVASLARKAAILSE